MKTPKQILSAALQATSIFKDKTLANLPVIQETYRTNDALTYKVFPAGSSEAFSAVEVRMEKGDDEEIHVSLHHSSNRFEETADALAQAQAMMTAASLMVQLKSMLLAIQAGD